MAEVGRLVRSEVLVHRLCLPRRRCREPEEMAADSGWEVSATLVLVSCRHRPRYRARVAPVEESESAHWAVAPVLKLCRLRPRSKGPAAWVAEEREWAH